MSNSDHRKGAPLFDAQTLAWLSIAGVGLMLGGLAWAAAVLGSTIEGVNADAIAAGPIDFAVDLSRGRAVWPVWSTVLLVVFVVASAAGAVFIAVTVGRMRRRRHSRVDSAAKHMGRGRDIEEISHKTALAKAQRLGVTSSPGVPIGRTVSPSQPIYGSWEDMHVDIWGPRTGKTTSRAVPAIMTAPGAVLATTNKRDLPDATRDARAKRGPVWVFDPQGVADEEPTWWWNPLSYVTDEVRAGNLASHFAAGGRSPDAKVDAYFDPAGEDLLAGLLLAAALDGRAITDVYRWLTRPGDDTAAEILRSKGFTLTGDQVAGVVDLDPKQRDGVFGTAKQMASCLTNRRVAAWITPQGENDTRPQFSPEEFVRSAGTLYSLSKEGKGTAGPIVTALTVAVVEAAEELAARSAGGRLTTPLLGVLDEAANVCRWRELPNLYSHYGSRGIVLMTILQSWSQGVEVWGEFGMRKLWTASNVRVYGGGGTTSDGSFLEDLARAIGPYDRMSTSTSYARGERTVSHQYHRERIMDVDDLAALPKGRAVVLASGSRATLIRTQPWMTAPYADEVRASIAAHDPQAARTLEEANRELATVQAALDSEEK